jgi:hypothetical protein
MAEGFDPYLHWLGIRDPQRPPNHYRLLGVELFESDPDVISNAADRQMAHVRTFQAGRRSAESQRVLNELAGAKVCLLTPLKKAAYDAQLQAELASVAPPSEVAAPALPPTLLKMAAQRLSLLWIALLALVAMGGVLAALLTFILSGGHSRDEDRGPAGLDEDAVAADAGQKSQPQGGATSGPAAKTTTEPPAKVAFKGPPPRPGESGKGAKPAMEPAKTTGPEAKSAPKPPAEPLPPASKSMQAARAVMKQRDVADARRHLDLAEKAAFPKDREQLDRLLDVFNPWEAFWTAVRAGILECKQGDVLRAGDVSAEVVRSGEDGLVVRIGGVERKFTLKDMPAPLALTIADKKLPENMAGLLKAAFLTVDPKGDPRQAMKLCEQSAGRGRPPSTGLAAELKEALAAKEAPPEHTPTPPKPPPRLPVPDAAAQQAAKRDVQEVFKARFAQARSPMEKGLLAGDLFREAKETKDNPAARFVLLALARDLAVTAGDPTRLRDVVLEMAKNYEIDPFEEQTRVLVEASESSLPSLVRASLAKAAIGLAQEAIQTDSYDAAAQLAKAGFSFASKVMASKGRDPHTIRQANELGELIPWYKQQYDLAQQAEKALAQDPNNLKAAQFLGKYYALVKDQWDRGLPLLVKGEDPTLKALAEAEQATRRSPSPPDMVKLADQWREAAASIEEPLQRSARRRALYWYEAVLPQVGGMTKQHVAGAVDALKQGETPRRKQ